MTKIQYEVQDKDAGWLPAVDGGSLAVAPKGIVGLDVTIDGDQHMDVAYQAYYNGKWNGEDKDGGKIGDGTTVFRALRVLISPRHNRHVKYMVIDDAFKAFNAQDDQAAGETVANDANKGLRTLRIDLA